MQALPDVSPGVPGDTIPASDSLQPTQILPSSKVIILSDQLNSKQDSGQTKLEVSEDQMIYSSKSGIILRSEDLQEITVDSLVPDSTHQE